MFKILPKICGKRKSHFPMNHLVAFSSRSSKTINKTFKNNRLKDNISINKNDKYEQEQRFDDMLNMTTRIKMNVKGELEEPMIKERNDIRNLKNVMSSYNEERTKSKKSDKSEQNTKDTFKENMKNISDLFEKGKEEVHQAQPQEEKTQTKIKKKDKTKNKNIQYEYLYGAASVQGALEKTLRNVKHLYIEASNKEQLPEYISPIVDKAVSMKINSSFLSRGKLERLALNKPHSGVVLKVEKRDYTMIKRFRQINDLLNKKQGNIIVLLDQIIDPFNLGSIIRTSVYYGVDMIILNKLNSPPISPAVSYLSLGASECTELYQVKFVENFIEDAKNNKWKVISTGVEISDDSSKNANSKESVMLHDFDIDMNDNVVLILGSEGKGVSSKLSKLADKLVYIPPLLEKSMVGKFPYNVIDSLNVGVTAGIILNHLTIQQKVVQNIKGKNNINNSI